MAGKKVAFKPAVRPILAAKQWSGVGITRSGYASVYVGYAVVTALASQPRRRAGVLSRCRAGGRRLGGGRALGLSRPTESAVMASSALSMWCSGKRTELAARLVGSDDFTAIFYLKSHTNQLDDKILSCISLIL